VKVNVEVQRRAEALDEGDDTRVCRPVGMACFLDQLRGNDAVDDAGACPRIENLLRKSYFGPFLRSFSLNMSNYSP